jgi:Family of unknown function (DUF5681)
MSDNDESGVGFKRPPRHTQFRPGTSGNPGGRPKRRPAFREILLEELASPVRADGISKLHAVVRSIVAAAIDGNGRAQTLLVGLLARIDDAPGESDSLTPEDRELLDSYVNGKTEGQK